MILIARQRIIGAKNDKDLYALDGIKYYESNTESYNELIDEFEKSNPDFIRYGCDYEIILDKKQSIECLRDKMLKLK